MNDIDLDKLRILNGKLAKLLADPEPGLFTWNLIVRDILKQLGDMA